jgi:hypothetical protein
MKTDKSTPASPSTDTLEQDQPQPEATPSLPHLDSAPRGSRLLAATLPNGERWEFDPQGKRTVYKPQ